MAGFQGYMNFPTIKGKCTDEKHKDWFHIDSYAFSAHQELKTLLNDNKHPGSFSAISITRTFDEASTQLLGVLCEKNVGQCIISVPKLGSEDTQSYITITLEDAQVLSYHTDGQLKEGNITEHISIHYSKIQIDYDPMSSKNKQKPGYSFECKLQD